MPPLDECGRELLKRSSQLREREEERDREQAQVCCLGVENEEGTKAS